MDLDDWRSRINDLDEQILHLLNQRGQAALQIGELKRQQDRPYFVPEREAQLIDRLLALNTGPLTADALRAVWREILSASLALENPLPVGYLGPAGTFTHAAAMRGFGTSAHLIPLKNIADIFEEVEGRRARRGEGRLLPSPGTRAVPAVAAGAPARRANGGDALDHRGGRAGERRPHGGGDRLGAGRPDLRRARAAEAHRRQSVQHHALPRDRTPPGRRHGTGQDLHPLLDEERTGRALQHSPAFRRAPAQHDQDRIATDQASSLGVRELRRLRGTPRYR